MPIGILVNTGGVIVTLGKAKGVEHPLNCTTFIPVPPKLRAENLALRIRLSQRPLSRSSKKGFERACMSTIPNLSRGRRLGRPLCAQVMEHRSSSLSGKGLEKHPGISLPVLFQPWKRILKELSAGSEQRSRRQQCSEHQQPEPTSPPGPVSIRFTQPHIHTAGDKASPVLASPPKQNLPYPEASFIEVFKGNCSNSVMRSGKAESSGIRAQGYYWHKEQQPRYSGEASGAQRDQRSHLTPWH